MKLGVGLQNRVVLNSGYWRSVQYKPKTKLLKKRLAPHLAPGAHQLEQLLLNCARYIWYTPNASVFTFYLCVCNEQKMNLLNSKFCWWNPKL